MFSSLYNKNMLDSGFLFPTKSFIEKQKYKVNTILSDHKSFRSYPILNHLIMKTSR